MAKSLRDKHIADALKYEQSSESVVSADLRKQLTEATRKAVKAYNTVSRGRTETRLPVPVLNAFLRVLERIFGQVDPSSKKELQRAVQAGLRIGVEQAMQTVGKKVTVNPRPDRELTKAVNQLDKKAKKDITDALDEVFTEIKRKKKVSLQDVKNISVKANKAVNRTESTTRWASNRAVNSGSEVVAAALNVESIWIAEYGACLHCLAYAGEVTKPGKPFKPKLFFVDPLTKTPVYGPPLHPNCRCRREPWLGTEKGSGTNVELPQVLKREAQRMVLRGASDYASEPAKLRAADKLLKKMLPSVPKSVVDRARRDIAAGKFS